MAVLYQFQYFYEKGDEAEKIGNFEKAILNYESTFEQLESLEKMGIPIGELAKADIYDRIAFCCEMVKKYDEAKQYYTQAMLLAVTEAKETNEHKAYDSAIDYAWKLASFCEEFGDKEESEKYYILRSILIEEKEKL